MNGKYKLECWGAQGNGTTGGIAGLGGYATGKLNIDVNTNIYICVGGHSVNYNNTSLRNINSVKGGGCTSITTSNKGELKEFKEYKNEVILVAGGGGGCERPGRGGAGGGLVGLNGVYTGTYHSYGTGGTQTTGGTNNLGGMYTTQVNIAADFGVGGSASMWSDGVQDCGAQGGGGWYGGGGGCFAGAGGGGSSYIGYSDLTDGNTISGNASMPSPFGGNQETGHAGDGECIITQIDFE